VTGPRGFARLSPEARRALGQRGAEAAKRQGAAGHRWTAEEARRAGTKGGRASRGGRGRPCAAVTEALRAAADGQPLGRVGAALARAARARGGGR
jgi:hypothetical protein